MTVDPDTGRVILDRDLDSGENGHRSPGTVDTRAYDAYVEPPHDEGSLGRHLFILMAVAVFVLLLLDRGFAFSLLLVAMPSALLLFFCNEDHRCPRLAVAAS